MSTLAATLSATKPVKSCAGRANVGRPPERIGERETSSVLEITCQDSEVVVLPCDDLWVIRACDRLTGIVVNIPVTTTALAALLPAEILAIAA